MADQPPGKSPGKSEEQPSDEPEDHIVCFCHNVSLRELLEAIRSGSTTLYDIQANTLATTGCGGCEYEVLEILEDELKKK